MGQSTKRMEKKRIKATGLEILKTKKENEQE